ncbi:MAG: endolytic transglycosylase MltG [Acidimicrobiia bacterium]
MKRGASRAATVLLAIVVVGVVAVIGGRGLANWAGRLGSPPDVTAPAGIAADLPVDMEVARGSSARQIGEQLAQAGVVESSLSFELAVRSAGVEDRLQAGTYRFVTGMSPGDALDVLLSGPESNVYRVTIHEGLRVSEILDRLAEQTPYTREAFEQALPGVTSSLGFGDGDLQNWEGGLFPDTYEFATDATPEEILQRLASTMEVRVASVDWSPLEQMGYGVSDGLIIASMIEAEARLDKDRPLIASVIVNRLEIGMPLQIDATVLYALGERGVGLTAKDLQTDSPYNTYRSVGLPPTPIDAPGLASLRAAAEPATTDYLYYVLTRPDGGHSFAATYEEFQAYKAQAKKDGVLP